MGERDPRWNLTGVEEEAAREVLAELERRCGTPAGEARLVRAPYRICPLGAHVDHQLGRVTGMALDRSLLLAFRPSGSSRVRLASLDFPGDVTFDLEEIPPARPGCWGNYARGAAMALERGHRLRAGIDGVLRGLLPVGGLSSSTAVGLACLLALEAANGLEIDPAENIELDRSIENTYLGLQNGILDQSVILLSRKDELLHLDCRTRAHRPLRFGGDPESFRILIVHSGIGRALISTDYNRHVAECREAARRLLELARQPVQDPPLLGQVPPEVYEAHAGALPDHLRRRALHFFGETARVEEGARAWEAGDLGRFGALLRESCRSSIENYRCGCPEQIALFEILADLEGVRGVRFSGAGYGGCCVALVDPEALERISGIAEERYLARFPERAAGFGIFPCRSAGGARVL